jgi:hypothetical protein
LLLGVVSNTVHAQACFKSAPAYEKLDDGAEYWHVELDPDWREAHVEIGQRLEKIRQDAQARANVDPIQLLKRQLKFFEQTSAAYSAVEHFINGDFGRIGKIGCVEAAMLELHLQSHGPSTEFVALILSKDRRYALHAMTFGELASVSQSKMFNEWIDQQVLEGWQVQVHLHNHPFIFFGTDLAGTIMASQGDVKVLKELHLRWGLKAAWITNGFHTAKFRHDEFPKLSQEWEISTAADPRFWR